MIKDYIIKYSSKITKDDIINFACKNNIILNSLEIETIYNSIHNEINVLLKNPILFLEKRKDKFENTTYLKIYKLITFYVEKYHL